jgi:isocitrate dehydrogenase
LGEFCALVPAFEHIAATFGNEKARLLAETLDQAIEKILEHGKTPSRKVHELDTRGSHFYLALYWAESLAAQDHDPELRARFAPVARQLGENEAKIVGELNAAQGQPVDLGGYYRPELEKAARALRPSPTFNSIVDALLAG